MSEIDVYKPRLDDIQFEHVGWELCDDLPLIKSWLTEKRDVVRLSLFRRGPVWPFDLTNIQQAKAFYSQEAQQLGGAVLQLDVEIIAGVEALVGVFKYRSPIENHVGMYYVGSIWLPFKGFMYQIHFEALEKGGVGLREAAYRQADAIQRSDSEGNEGNKEECALAYSREEILAKFGKRAVLNLPSDSPQYDSDFPDHPLTKVRQNMNKFKSTVVVSDDLKRQPQYRL